ncbi:MAG: SRPBCC family protein [Chloroflexota bacterium]
MTTITTSRTIHAPASKVWEVIADYHNADVYHPLLASVERLNEIDQGVGASRQCNLYNNSSIVETVTEWENGRSFTVETNEQPIFGKTRGKMSIKPIDAHSSKITVTTTYTPKWGLIGKALDSLLLRMIVNQAVKRVLNGLQHHIETGEAIGKGGKPIPLTIRPVSS